MFYLCFAHIFSKIQKSVTFHKNFISWLNLTVRQFLYFTLYFKLYNYVKLYKNYIIKIMFVLSSTFTSLEFWIVKHTSI